MSRNLTHRPKRRANTRTWEQGITQGMDEFEKEGGKNRAFREALVHWGGPNLIWIARITDSAMPIYRLILQTARGQAISMKAGTSKWKCFDILRSLREDGAGNSWFWLALLQIQRIRTLSLSVEPRLSVEPLLLSRAASHLYISYALLHWLLLSRAASLLFRIRIRTFAFIQLLTAPFLFQSSYFITSGRVTDRP